jgi:LDH2 family malate/lactate/ureidoglycolate dehydrogenase
MRTDASSIGAEDLSSWTVSILRAAGASPPAAAATARTLVDANLRGLDSHGVVFLSFYLPRLRSGATNGAAEPELLVDLPALALVDGHDGLGGYVATFAMDHCCDKATTAGAAVVAVRNSTHFGAASCYADQAARRDCIGIVLSNSDPGMGPLGALAPVLGTNPLAIAAPGADERLGPSLDMATSVVAQGKIILASRAGQAIPDGWAIGADGAPTTDPDDALSNSVLPMAGHKGFALAFMIDVLAGCLPGALTSPWIPGDPAAPEPQGTGHLMLAIHVPAIARQTAYGESLRRLAEHVHEAPRADWAAPFLIPGEPEARTQRERAVEGIPLTPSTLSLLRALGEEYGVRFPA